MKPNPAKIPSHPALAPEPDSSVSEAVLLLHDISERSGPDRSSDPGRSCFLLAAAGWAIAATIGPAIAATVALVGAAGWAAVLLRRLVRRLGKCANGENDCNCKN